MDYGNISARMNAKVYVEKIAYLSLIIIPSNNTIHVYTAEIRVHICSCAVMQLDYMCGTM